MNYKDGQVRLDIHDEILTPLLRGPHRAAVLESVACHDDVIRHVADQILEGWTENGNCGATYVEAEPQCALSIARRRVALGADDVAAREIRELARRVDVLETENSRLRSELIEADRRSR
jgi:hypothetical protein